jgi:integrase
MRAELRAWHRSDSDKVDLKSWRIHDLRRTAATGMERLGIKQQVVEALLGHIAGSKAGVTGIYQLHTYEDEKRAALEIWAKHVTALPA